MGALSSQIMTLEDWEEIMLAYVDEVGWIVVPFFLLIVIVGKEVILGLFIAVMVQAFEARTDTQVRAERPARYPLGPGEGKRRAPLMSCVDTKPCPWDPCPLFGLLQRNTERSQRSLPSSKAF